MLLILTIVVFAVAIIAAAGLISLYDANVDQRRINDHFRFEIEELRNQLRDFLNSDIAWIYDQGREAGRNED